MEPKHGTAPGASKKLAFRLAAVLLGLSPLLVCEVACRVFDWGRPTQLDDPYVGFSAVHPLFELDARGERYEIPPSRLKWFCRESFAAQKPAGGGRIFVLGGSTVQGQPYTIETSFTTWLEISLNLADPGKSWDVVNCGGSSYASYRLLPILKEVLTYEPDMVIVCTGANEFLEDRSYAHLKGDAGLVVWLGQQLARLRTYNLIRGGVLSLARTTDTEPPGDRPILPGDVDARLDFRGGMEAYHRDDPWQGGVNRHFDASLRKMAALAKDAAVPLVFIGDVSNLDWPPFKSQHGDEVSTRDRARIDEQIAHATPAGATPGHAALAALEEAAALDERYALAHFQLGKHYQALGRLDEARAALTRAMDEDVCPLRMPTTLRETFIKVAADTGMPWLDAHAYFAERSPGGIPGNRWLVDHVHPTIEGHQLIAEELMKLLDGNIVRPREGWQTSRQQAYARHLEHLDPTYFPRGRERLRGLLIWAFGKVTLERDQEP
jgi:hypothetical protein